MDLITFTSQYTRAISTINAAFATKSSLFAKAIAVTTDIFVLEKIAGHITLAVAYFASKCKKFTKLTEAIRAAEESNDNILVHFMSFGLFGVYEPQQYAEFCGNLRNTLEEASGDINPADTSAVPGLLDMYQVVLCGKRQKLVFACDNSDFFEQLQKLATACFGVESYRDESQISVDIMTTDETDILKKFTQFTKYVEKHGSSGMKASMHTVQVESEDEYLLRQYRAGGVVLTAEGLEEIIRRMFHAPPVSININNITNSTINGNVINGSTVTTQSTPTLEDAAVAWIAANPPRHHEPSPEYYKRYSSNHTHARLPNTSFHPLAKSLGYTTIKSNGTYKYVNTSLPRALPQEKN
jgi:hypothetical protein